MSKDTIAVNATFDTPRLNELISQLGPDGRAEINVAATYSLWADTRRHMGEYAQSHHDTARTIEGGPARQTGHLEDAAQNMTWVAGSDVAYVQVAAAGIGRVFDDLEIRPRNKQALTIPIHAMAYGRRVSEVQQAHTVFRPRGKNYLAVQNPDGEGILPIYVLARKASVPQDRNILPSDDELRKSAIRGIRDLLFPATEGSST